MLVMQERDANNNALVTYTRGLDLSGTRQGAGGIGGLLARSQLSTSGYQHAFYHSDAGGNITTMVDSGGNVVARYLYDPYGNLLSKSGLLADANTYRFSSKEFHPNSGLYYYGFRFYDPNLQRWLNQDPIREAGGINLYGFVGNSPLNQIDLWGFAGPAEEDLEPEGEITREIVRGLQYGRLSRYENGRYVTDAEFEAREKEIEQNTKWRNENFEPTLPSTSPEPSIGPLTPKGQAQCSSRSGRRGNTETQNQLNDIRDQFLEKNPEFTHTHGGKCAETGEPLKEEYIPGAGGGRKGSSYPDLTFQGPNFNVRVNTVDTAKSGFMSTRELNNYTRIMEQTGEPIIAVPKPK